MALAKKQTVLEKLVPVLTLVSLVLAFMVGVLWQRVDNIEKNGTVAGTQATAQAQQPAQTQASLDTIKGLYDNKDVIKFGKKDAKISFVEVADPSCPYCHVAAGHNPELAKQIDSRFVPVSDGGSYVPPVQEMKKLVDSGDANFVYIYTPGHGNGELGMKALYCANEKDKFWQVHDLLMSNAGYNMLNNTVQNDVANSGTLAEFLKPAIDQKFMEDCLKSGKYDSRLTADTQLASQIGVSGTPGFYINATIFRGAYSYTDMQSAVDEALKS